MTTGTRASKPDQRRDRYLQSLLAGDDDAAHAVVKTMLTAGAAISEIYIDLLTPAMTRVGELWHRKKINVAQQKLATEITFKQMERLRSLAGAKEKSIFRALVCCIEGEQHSTGAEMAADLLRLEGWSVAFLGPDVPTQDILAMVKNRQPQVLALSITMKQNLKQLRLLLEALSTHALRPKVLIGGQATRSLRRWTVKGVDLNVASTLIDGLHFALAPYRSTKPITNLEQYLKDIGARIRELRISTEKTQAQLAESSGLNRAYIVSVEHGRQNMSMAVIIKIANALGVDTKELLVP